jgi:hypothetical protein
MKQAPKTYIEVDPRLYNPGIVGIPGIDQSKPRDSMDDFGCWYAENVEPSFKGWNNRKIGVVKRNTSAPTPSKVQGIWGLGDNIYFVANGNFYSMPDSGGTVTMPSGGAGMFGASVRVRGALNQGKSGTGAIKLYLCDGINAPRVFSSATDTISSLSLGGSYGIPQTVGTWQRRTGWTFVKGGADENRILFSQEEDGDNYNTAGSSVLDAFDDYIWPGDGDWVVGFGSVQFKGQDAQKDALIVCKSQRSFMATEVALNGGIRTVTFNANGVDIGAVSPDALIQFGNDLWILTKTGIKGFNTVLAGSGGVSSFSNSPVSGINRLVEESARNSAFSNAFAVHHAEKKKIRIFLPRNASTSAIQNGFNYGEIPNDYALCYGYGLLPQWEGNQNGEGLYARGGAGFAFSCGCVHKGRLFLGDYFGNIYEIDCEDAGDDYIPLPGESHQVIYGQWCTPYMRFGQSYFNKKRIVEILLHGYSSDNVEYNFNVTKLLKQAPYEVDLPTLTILSGNTGTSDVYGTAIYGTSIYGAESGVPNKISIRPPGWANAFGIKNWFPSKRLVNGLYRSNHIWIYGVSGKVEIGQ